MDQISMLVTLLGILRSAIESGLDKAGLLFLLSSVEDKIEDMRSPISSLVEQNKLWEKRYHELEELYAVLQNQWSSATSQEDRLTAEWDKLSQDYAELEEVYDNLRNEYALLTKSHNHVGEKLHGLQTKLDELRDAARKGTLMVCRDFEQCRNCRHLKGNGACTNPAAIRTFNVSVPCCQCLVCNKPSRFCNCPSEDPRDMGKPDSNPNY